MLVKVTGTNLVRDTNTMALINTDNQVKNEYYEKLRMLKSQKEEINKVNEGTYESNSNFNTHELVNPPSHHQYNSPPKIQYNQQLPEKINSSLLKPHWSE